MIEYDKINGNRYVILKLIINFPGIRYNDLARITKFNNGVLTHSLKVLEKNNRIKVFRSSSGSTKRYFSPSVPNDDFQIIGYLKNNTSSKIILHLHCNKDAITFDEIKNYIQKSSSTTSWHLKKLLDDNIIAKLEGRKKNFSYALKDPLSIDRITKDPNNLCLDRVLSSSISLIEIFSPDKIEVI